MASNFKVHRLANGLTIIGEPNPKHASTALGYFVKTGARDETIAESGVSHFLEHMIFKGTEKRSAIEITMELGNLGVQANAFTSEENTVYYGAVLPENLAQFHELLSDMLRPALDSHEFDTEKKVILEEIALYEDRPQFFLFDNALRQYFGKHPAGNSVLGSVQSISDLTRDQMHGYFSRRYSTKNITLACSGNFIWEDLIARADKLCSKWPSADVSRDHPSFETAGNGSIFRRKRLNQAHAVLVSKGASAQDTERYELAVLSTILGDSSGSKLYWELVDPGIAESAHVDNDERDGVGCFTAYFCSQPERLDEVIDRARKILSVPLNYSEEDLTRAKAKLAARVVLGGELPMGRLMAMGMEWAYHKESTTLEEIVARIQRISSKDIEAAAQKYGLATKTGRQNESFFSEYRLLPEE